MRSPAIRTRISSLINGIFRSSEDELLGSYIITPEGKKIHRARIMGTVVNIFKSEDGNFASATLDDGTGTIRVKVWNEGLIHLEDVRKSQLLDVAGRVRQYNDEIYISPEMVVIVHNHERELFHRAAVLKNIREQKRIKELVISSMDEFDSVEDMKKTLSERYNISVDDIEAIIFLKNYEEEKESLEVLSKEESQIKKEESDTDKLFDDLTEEQSKVLDIIKQLIENGRDFVTIEDIAKESEFDTNKLEKILHDLMSSGDIYEPKPGKYTLIS